MAKLTDSFSYIGLQRTYGDDLDQFKEDYKTELELISKDGKINQKTIIAAYCLKEISKGNSTETIQCNKILTGEKKIKNLFKRIVLSYNKKLFKSKRELAVIYAKKHGRKIIVIIGYVEPGTGLTTRTIKSYKNLSKNFFCIVFDKENIIVEFFNISHKIKELILWWLKVKNIIWLPKHEPIKIDKEKIKNIFNKVNQKFYLIDLKRTKAPGSGESVIIKSKTGNALQQALDWEKDGIVTFSLDTLNQVKTSIGNSGQAKLMFNKSKLGKKITYFGSRYALPKEFRNIINKGQIIFDNLDFNEILTNVIYRQDVEPYYFNLPQVGTKLNEMIKVKLLRKKQNKLYWCSNPSCDVIKPIKQKICECGNPARRSFTISYSIKPNKKQIEFQTINLLKKEKIKTTKYLAKALNLNKNDFAIRIEKGGKYFYLYFSKNSIGKEKFEKLKLLGIPLIIIKLKGELNSNMVGLSNVEGLQFIDWLAGKKSDKIISLIQEAIEKSSDLMYESFRAAITIVKAPSPPTPEEFENSIYAILNFMFPHNQKLGGPKLADGAFAFEGQGTTQFVLWDAKRYTKTKLSSYIKEKKEMRIKFPTEISKDIKYMNNFERNFKVKKHGGLKYYVFLTYETDKDDFDKAKESLSEQLKKTKNKAFKIKSKIWVSCIDRINLLKLTAYLSSNPDVLKNNRNKFYKIIKYALRVNNGYFDFYLIKEKLDKLVDGIQPTSQELRKTI